MTLATRYFRYALACFSVMLFAGNPAMSPAQTQEVQLLDVVVIVSVQNPLNSLNRTQVEDIFLGRTLQFPDGRRANPVDQTQGSAVRDHFTENILQRTPAQIRSHWSRIVFIGKGRPPRTVDSSEDVLRVVSADPEAIGYIERRYLNDTVKVVLE